MAEPFTTAQVDQFAEDGFLVVPNVVDQRRRDACLRAVNHWISTEFDRSEFDTYREQTFARPFTTAPETLALVTETAALGLAAALVGRPVLSPTDGQFALRFPVAPGTEPRAPVAHLDGLPAPSNGIPADGDIRLFSVLAGVLLSDMEAEGHGNFTVWPGSHVQMASWFAQNGTRFRDASVVFDAVAEIAKRRPPAAVCGRAGDLILAHSLLLHGSGRHTGPAIRYIAFFRLDTEARAGLGDSVFTDVWAEWETIRARRS